MNNWLVNISVLLLFICLRISFFSNTGGIVFQIILSTVLMYAILIRREISASFEEVIPLLLLLALFIWHGRENSLTGLIGDVFNYLSILVIVLLKPQEKHVLKIRFIRFFSVLASVSLVAWVFHLFGYDLFSPTTHILFRKYPTVDYFFFTVPEGDFFMRFSCLFSEPGTFGMLCVIVMLLNGLKWDRYTIIPLISSLFTLSLATYLLLILVGFYYIYHKTNKLIVLIVPFMLLYATYYIGTRWNNGANLINGALLSRLEMYDGELQHYNRRSVDFEDYFEQEVIRNSFFTGVGYNKYIKKGFEQSVDYKAYIALDGLIGLLLIVGFYLLLYLYHKNKSFSFLFMMVFVIIFARGFPFAFMSGTIITYFLFYISDGRKLKIKVPNKIIILR